MTASPDVLQEFLEKTGALATPVLDIGGELVRGWDRGKVARLLGIGAKSGGDG